MVRPKSESNRVQPETDTVNVACTVMTDDTLPCVMVSANPGIEIVQQYGLVVS